MTDTPTKSPPKPSAEKSDIQSGSEGEPARTVSPEANHKQDSHPPPLALSAGDASEHEREGSNDVTKGISGEQQPPDPPRVGPARGHRCGICRCLAHPNAPGWAQFFAGVVTAAFAGLAIIYAADQSAKAGRALGAADDANRLARQALNQQIEAARQAAKATDDALVEARKANDIAREQTRMSLRAWMVFKVVERVRDTNPRQWRIVLTNAGATPAVHTAVVSDQKERSERVVPEFKYPGGPVGSDERAERVVGPNVEIWVPATGAPGVGKRLYVYGDLDYFDIFGEHHWLHFCTWLAPGEDDWVMCDVHNDTGTYETKKSPEPATP